MFRKYDKIEKADYSSDDSRSKQSASSSDRTDPFDSFDDLGDDDLMDIEFSDQLSYKSDNNWNDMMNSYDELNSDNGTQTKSPTSGNSASAAENNRDNTNNLFDDDLGDDFGDDSGSDFGDDLGSDFGDDFDTGSGSNAGSDFDSSFDDDFDSGYDRNRSGENRWDDDRHADKEEEPKPLFDTRLFTRLIIAMVAIIFGIGVLLVVKITGNQSHIYTPSYVSDSSLTDSDGSVPSGEEPQEASSQEQEEVPVSQAEKQTYVELTIGSTGYEVLTLQSRLMELGYIGKDSCTGYYGEFTTKIVKRFQKNAGLPQTGNADQATQEKLYSADAPKNEN